MTYAERLRKRWVVVRLLPNCQTVDVAYFCRYTDAQNFALLMSRLDLAYRFEVMFEPNVQCSSIATSQNGIDRKITP
ncbi:hypothetical protein H6F67_19600 [Microcoleus sp. FACHB-1515]|uniref:hypothetical protein n=1 Tax=Cyanophyceae TaxID=3028117 RepID=UPI001685C1B1|nr:hypothetical protein [Microcoleus sp. FACHB-1515]MBD2092057.1 hypothetical protein [Microcoleus sp. FACHB-1515]